MGCILQSLTVFDTWSQYSDSDISLDTLESHWSALHTMTIIEKDPGQFPIQSAQILTACG